MTNTEKYAYIDADIQRHIKKLGTMPENKSAATEFIRACAQMCMDVSERYKGKSKIEYVLAVLGRFMDEQEDIYERINNG